MNYSTISIENRGPVVVLSLNQPNTLNAMSMIMADEFYQAIGRIRNDPNVRVLIVAGAGSSFCSGGDLNGVTSMLSSPPVEARQKLENMYKSFLSVRSLEIPTIAALKGYTLGAGLCLAVACDMRIASKDSKLAMSFTKIGINPGMGGTYLLPRLVGIGKALELCLAGDIIDSSEALKIGLLNYVVEPEQLMGFTLDFAGRIAANPAITTALIKKAIYQNQDKDLESALTLEALFQVTCSSTEDTREAIAAKKEKRSPVFKGR